MDSGVTDYVCRLVNTFPEITEVWLSGSRANGTANGNSDWDLIGYSTSAARRRRRRLGYPKVPSDPKSPSLQHARCSRAALMVEMVTRPASISWTAQRRLASKNARRHDGEQKFVACSSPPSLDSDRVIQSRINRAKSGHRALDGSKRVAGEFWWHRRGRDVT